MQKSSGPSRAVEVTCGGPCRPSASSDSPDSEVPPTGAWEKRPLPRLPAVAKVAPGPGGRASWQLLPLALLLCVPNGASVLRSTGAEVQTAWVLTVQGQGAPSGVLIPRFEQVTSASFEPQFPHL